MIVTGALALDQLTETELVERLRIGAIDPATFGAEVERREQAERRSAAARAARKVEQTRWYDAAHAQWQRAEAYCSGNFYSPFGKAEAERNARKLASSGQDAPIGNGMALWQGGEDWARKRASLELCNFWDADGGRLSLALWREQQAAERRRALDERDLAELDSTEQATPAGPVWEAVPGGRVAETTVTASGRQHAAWFAVGADGSATLHRTRELAAAHLAPAEPPRPVVPPMSPGAIARYMAALSAAGDRAERTAARMEAALQRIGRNQR